MADLDPPGDLKLRGTGRTHITGFDLGRFDGAIGGEVTTHRQLEDVATGLIGTGDPARAVNHPRIDEIADLGDGVLTERLGTDIALDQCRMLGKLRFIHGRGNPRMQHCLESLDIDLAITREPNHQGVGRSIRQSDGEHHILQRVSGRPGPIVPRLMLVGMVDQRLDCGCVRRVFNVRRGRLVDRQGSRNRGDNSFNICRIVT